ncbi:carbon-nitrogen hydrolase family protein [Chromohalobacter sarecensis]|uniref:Carbon-nitrogen hydrolase family protein n=1 Tax=Chromohalobacter sarecensis TaxID=245294 RepID=A0ABV9D0K8_9GAMM|nr:carbon-nitrogen hydrolase family protein [Chromohalobacter sarecensis]MCK0715106.1 carbon-nitrogen hydrolase family protein [Chromohalobacter sarecensis]
MQIALAQLAGREGDIAYNLSRTLACLRDAAPETSLIVFPETHLTGFAEPGHVDDRTLTLDGDELATLIAASREHDTALALGFLERDGEHVFNTTVLITPEDGIALRYRKAHLWPDERDLVAPGDRVGCIEWRGLQVGLLICYDLEFPEPARALGQLGCDLLLVTNGNMDPYGPMHARAAQARAQDNHYFVAMTNRAGEGAGLTFAGESSLVAPDGEALFRAGREESVTTLQLDPQRLPDARRDYDYLKDCRIGLQGQREDTERGRYWHF